MSHRTLRTLLVVALAAAGCDGNPTGEPGGGPPVALTIQASAGLNSVVALIVVEVTGPGIPVALVGNFPLVDGTAVGTLIVPAGSARVFAARGFDADGNITHEGTTTENVWPGMSTIRIPLLPRGVGVPIETVISAHQVAIDPTTAGLETGATQQFTATVTTADDGGIAVDPAELIWASTNPAFVQVNASGLATALQPGTAQVVVSFQGVAAAATVTVAENGEDPPGAAVFVSTSDVSAADDSGCGLGPGPGGGHYPCRTIGQGLARAQALGRTAVQVANGTYTEAVTLAAGIDLLGGYSPDTWVRNVAATNTIIDGASAAGNHDRTVIATGITTATIFEGFVIRGALNAKPGGNSYAVYIAASGASLIVRDNVIQAGRGGPGVPGTAGASGASGAAGIGRAANPATYDAFVATGTGACNAANNRQHNNGGAMTHGSDNVSGGRGGGNVCPPSTTLQQQSAINGLAGLSAAATGSGVAGDPGGGGFDGRLESSGAMCVLPGAPMAGAAGQNGAPGAHGLGGGGGSGGSVVSGHWFGFAGQAGASGRHGGGGGGGGAGGGSGGGGGAGGSAIGIMVAGGGAPVLENNVITRGEGSTGGAGGNGGGSGTGGVGADGGLSAILCAGAGGRGGDGGSGGWGGGGGGGRGGSSIGILTSGIGTPGYCQAAAGNAISGGAAGPGGAGGLTLGMNGEAGAAGSLATCSFH